MDPSNDQVHGFKILKRIFRWNHARMQKPILHPDICNLSAIPRSVGILRFRICALLYALDSSGATREILKFIFLAILIGLPAIGLVSIVLLLLQRIFEALMTIVGIIIVTVMILAFFNHK